MKNQFKRKGVGRVLLLPSCAWVQQLNEGRLSDSLIFFPGAE